jgi:hypothetical protein
VVEQYPINFSFVCGALSFDLVEQYLLDLVEILLHKIKRYCSTHKGKANGILLHHLFLVDFPNGAFFPQTVRGSSN